MRYGLPQKPFTLVQAYNRAALATGSCRLACAGSQASYNGHRYMVFKNVRGWAVSYTWAGLNWVHRGGPSLRDALLAAKRRYDAGGAGSEVWVSDVGPDDVPVLEELGFVRYEDEDAARYKSAWADDRFHRVFEALRMEKDRGIPASMLLESSSAADWDQKVREFIAARRRPSCSSAPAA